MTQVGVRTVNEDGAAPPEDARTRRVRGAVTGVLVVAAALGASELARAFISPESAPVAAVAQRMINDSPEGVKSFAISTFGTNDKLALTIGILVVMFVLAAVLGALARGRPWVGNVAVAGLGAVGCLAAVSQPGASVAWAIPSILGAAAAWFTLALLRPAGAPARAHAGPGESAPDPEDVPASGGMARRGFLERAATIAVVAAGAAIAGRALGGRRLAGDISRAQVHIPAPVATSPAASPIPSVPTLDVARLTPLVTPNARFYRVDTAFVVPQISAQDWRLRIHGMVERELEIDFNELLARPLIEREVTLTCVSNEVGGKLAGNARWVGVPLAPLLQEAGVKSGATQIVGMSHDGMTIGTPVGVAMDGRDGMLAVEMNGEPLPVEHGFPVRMIVPGLYGYESATKWLVDLELTTNELTPYWVGRGWARSVPIKTESRIDTPSAGSRHSAGTIPVAGVAWAQHRGIERVEVRVDSGPWHTARLGPDHGVDAWRQWVWEWPATSGDHVLQARATDATGTPQTGAVRKPYPSGATGWPRVEMQVS
jgi:DMSO/TMAO reductase YedYZ molybdopterin-dependent catalytic subunit